MYFDVPYKQPLKDFFKKYIKILYILLDFFPKRL